MYGPVDSLFIYSSHTVLSFWANSHIVKPTMIEEKQISPIQPNSAASDAKKTKIISKEKYWKIISLFDPFFDVTDDAVVGNLLHAIGISGICEWTLRAIYSHWIVDYVKRNYHRYSVVSSLKIYWEMFIEGRGKFPLDSSISLQQKTDPISTKHQLNKKMYELSRKIMLPPCVLARLLLKYYCDNDPNACLVATTNSLDSSAQSTKSVSKKAFSILFKRPHLIEDEYLRTNVEYCCTVDRYFSPFADKLKQEKGIIHEELIENFLTDNCIFFINEVKMREFGFPKTPDFVLSVPIAIYNGKYIVNWIESKASFGDENSHQKYLNDQYWSYHNRFGPGLVIYWNGYIAELNCLAEKGIVLSIDLPTSIQRIQSPYLMQTEEKK